MPPLSKICLHLGLPKTGTSWVQDKLRSERDRLAALDILYPTDSDFGDENSGNATFLARYAQSRTSTHQLRSVIENMISDIPRKSETGPKTLCLSSEVLSTLTTRQYKDLFLQLRSFCDGLVLVLVRRNREQIQRSLYSQALKRHRETRSLEQFIAESEHVFERMDRLDAILKTEVIDKLDCGNIDLKVIEWSDVAGIAVIRAMIGDFAFAKVYGEPEILRNARTNSSVPAYKVDLLRFYNAHCCDFAEKLYPDGISDIDESVGDHEDEKLGFSTNALSERLYSASMQDPRALMEILKSLLHAIALAGAGRSRDKYFFEAACDLNFFIRGLSDSNGKYRTEVPADFDPITYYLLNPDVLEAQQDPWEHYVLYGKAEGRRYSIYQECA